MEGQAVLQLQEYRDGVAGYVNLSVGQNDIKGVVLTFAPEAKFIPREIHVRVVPWEG